MTEADDAERALHARASEDREQACDFAGAAREALAADDPRRAAFMAALAGDTDLGSVAVERIANESPRDEALRAAADLDARGFGRSAGMLFEKLGAHIEAARAFAESGDEVRAAASFDLAGKPVDAARVLEAALRLRPEDGVVRLALGRLLARHGRVEAAAKALQQIPADSSERKASLPLLRRCLGSLGLEEGARTVELEMQRLGVADEEPANEAIRSAPPGHGGELVLGRYEIVREVAVTMHARVLEAIDRVSAARVAVKLLAGLGDGSGRDALLRFEREARALARLRHPNVVPLVEYHAEGPAMVLPWMSGGSLADRMRVESMAPARAVEIVAAVLSALGEAHRLGILHRDVKPSNVLFDDAGAARLSDFGAAHLGDLSTTATAGAIGTFAYMSPEQRLGQPATIASDVYAAGVLLGELLTGDPVAATTATHLAPELGATNPELGDEHDAALARLVQEDPKRRPADAFEARRILLALRWPEQAFVRAPRSVSARVSERPSASSGRLGPSLEGDGRDADLRQRDAWLERDVIVLPLDEGVLARVRAFARADHPALPCVLRIDAATNAVWVAPPRGRALADQARGLSPGQIARLRSAVLALHAAGGAHGAIDTEHLYFFDGEVTLAFPRDAHASDDEAVARDQKALDELTAGG